MKICQHCKMGENERKYGHIHEIQSIASPTVIMVTAAPRLVSFASVLLDQATDQAKLMEKD